MSTNSSSKLILGFHPRDLNLSSFKAYLTSCPFLEKLKSIQSLKFMFLSYNVIILFIVSKLDCSNPPAMLYISFDLFNSIILIIASVVSWACNQFIIVVPLLYGLIKEYVDYMRLIVFYQKNGNY